MTLFNLLMWSVAGLVVGQSQPDFSGQWVLVSPADPEAAFARELTVRQEVQRTTAAGAPMAPYFKTLVVDRHFPTGVRSESHEIGIVGGWVGGIDRTGRGSDARGTRSVKWDGDRLVIENASYAGAASTEHKEVWSLDAQRRLVITITTRTSSAEPKSTTLTYRPR